MFQNKKPEYRVLVCGGRDYGKRWDEHLSEFIIDSHLLHNLYSVLKDIKDTRVPEGHELVIVHGAARGADSMASTWAKTQHIKEMPFPADWSGGRSGGIQRNIQMLEDSEPSLVVAFPGGAGTAHMVSLARKTRTPLMVIEDES